MPLQLILGFLGGGHISKVAVSKITWVLERRPGAEFWSREQGICTAGSVSTPVFAGVDFVRKVCRMTLGKQNSSFRASASDVFSCLHLLIGFLMWADAFPPA